MRKRPLTFYLAKPKWNAKAILKTYDRCVYGNIYYITNLFCKKWAKNSHTLAKVLNCMSLHFFYYHQYVFVARDV
jgi:hypothetical protein